MVIESFIYNCFINDKLIVKKIVKKYIIIGILGVFAFSIFGNFRSGSGMMKNIFRPRHQYKKIPVSVMWIYSYTEFSFSNFNNLVSKTNGGINNGISTLNYVLPTIVRNKINLKTPNKIKYIITDSFNVSTWFPEIFLDFGIIGIAFFSIMIGVLGAYLYKRACIMNSDYNSIMYAIYTHNIVMFFFVNMFLYIPVVTQFLISWIVFHERKIKK